MEDDDSQTNKAQISKTVDDQSTGLMIDEEKRREEEMADGRMKAVLDGQGQ